LDQIRPEPGLAFIFAIHCNADQRTRNAATRCVLRACNAAKCDCGRSSATDPAGVLTAYFPDSLAGFKGADSRRGGGGGKEGRGGREREREERGREGGEEGGREG